MYYLATVDENYCKYLYKFDSYVPINWDKKSGRPFVGVLFTIGDYDFYAPLSSPRDKHLTMKNAIDFFKIENGELGVVNLNNMIPVSPNNVRLINIDKIGNSIEEQNYKTLLKKQKRALNRIEPSLSQKAIKLYYKYINGTLNSRIVERCCNYPLLETKCIEWARVQSISKNVTNLNLNKLFDIYDNLEDNSSFEEYVYCKDKSISAQRNRKSGGITDGDYGE